MCTTIQEGKARILQGQLLFMILLGPMSANSEVVQGLLEHSSSFWWKLCFSPVHTVFSILLYVLHSPMPIILLGNIKEVCTKDITLIWFTGFPSSPCWPHCGTAALFPQYSYDQSFQSLHNPLCDYSSCGFRIRIRKVALSASNSIKPVNLYLIPRQQHHPPPAY